MPVKFDREKLRRSFEQCAKRDGREKALAILESATGQRDLNAVPDDKVEEAAIDLILGRSPARMTAKVGERKMTVAARLNEMAGAIYGRH